MILILILLTSLYTAALFRLSAGLRQLKKGTNVEKLSVSVIVAARNEEKNIEKCLLALAAQHYPQDKLEIIIVDDRSVDGTADVVKKYMTKFDNIHLTPVTETPTGIAPKKYALDQGIQAASGEVLLFTDADGVPPADWVRAMISYFEPTVGLVAGFSPLDRAEKPSLFTKLVCLDSLALAAVAAGSFGAGFPLTCNARNIAYRKKVYTDVGGFQKINHLVSGDDDLFLHQVRQHGEWEMRYAIDEESRVSALAPANFQEFKNQRIRHASKGRHYSLALKSGLSAVYLLNLMLFVLPVLSLWQPGLFRNFLIFFFLKAASEFSFIRKAAIIFKYAGYLTYFPLAAVLHLPYVTIFGLWGQLGKFKWKDDIFNATVEPTTEAQGK